jgi:hypothetical protein
MATKKTRFNADKMEHIEQSDLVQLSREMLDSVVRSTGILDLDEMSPEDLKSAKLALGYLNAANSTMITRMNYFRMTGIEAKIDAVSKRSAKM